MAEGGQTTASLFLYPYPTMNERILPLEQGQHLSDVFPDGIPSNIILHKTLCGIGATTLEINAHRHSIIIEPNVPVIQGKAAQHPEVLGVYEGVTKQQIADYVNGCCGYCKILTTPESFIRVRQAMWNTDKILSRDFFLLFDECEKLVQDVEYRTKITLPVDLFFKCQNKAMVSATPIIPSDPRFEEQGFELVKIAPTFPYKEKLTLLQTNNVYTLFSYILNGIPSDQKVCVFFNSTSGIAKLIQRERIENEASIFCSTDAASRLREKGFNASDCLSIDDGTVELPRIAFFTSRFFSAVDITLPTDEKPVVIILTELYTAPHSMIDPKTETTQIIGRFRKGILAAYHIMNNNPEIETRTDEELDEYLAGAHRVYKAFFDAYLQSESEGEQATLRQALVTVDYARFVQGNCEKNTFMYDNAFNEEHVKILYKEYDAVYDAYEKAGAFEVSWKKIHLCLSDKNRMNLEEQGVSKTKLNRQAFLILRDLLKRHDQLDIIQLAELKSSFGLLVEAFEVLGPATILEVGFRDRDLQQAIAKTKATRQEKSPGVVKAVYTQIKENRWYSTAEINRALKRVYAIFGLPCDGRGMADKITLYFEAERQNHAEARGWYLGKRLL